MDITPVRLVFYVSKDYEVKRTTVVRSVDGTFDLDAVKSSIEDFRKWLFIGCLFEENREFEIKDVYTEVSEYSPLARVAILSCPTGVFHVKLPTDVLQDLAAVIGNTFGYKMLLQEVVNVLAL